MRIFKNSIFLLIISIFLCSCGLQVVYKERKDDVSYTDELAAIRIKKEHDSLNQKLKNNLYDMFGVGLSEKIEPKYLLIPKISKTIQSTFTTITGASGRNLISLEISYELKNLNDASTISTGSTMVNDSYDISNNRFGTITAEDYVITTLIKVASRNLRNMIINDINEFKKNQQ